MSHAYRAIGWNPQKRRYDTIAAAASLGCVATIAAGTAWRSPDVTIETLLIRGFGVTAFLLLHVVLSIGPLCRLDRRLLPLLYNRRHLGVLTFLSAAVHGGIAFVQFHSGGDVDPLVSLLMSGGGVAGLQPPFQVFGMGALAVLFVMAATSHDFWLRTLTAPIWKTLHMGVYAAYAALVLHVSFGVLQSEVPPWAGLIVGAGLIWIAGLHTLAARRERPTDRIAGGAQWVDAGPADRIPDKRARIVCAAGERIAVFRYDGRISAVSNVCQHQNGPLGEGKIVGGCIVCPWHGYEYAPATGAAPPPFLEAVPTFKVAIREGRVFVYPRPLPPGTFVEPARVEP